jgi:RNA polymerase sigma factor (sigma-70 family)
MEDGNRPLSEFNALFYPLLPAVYAWASTRLRPYKCDSEAGDFTHDVYVRAGENYDGKIVTRERFRSWVFGIARYVLLEWFRDLNSRKQFGIGIGGDNQQEGAKAVTSVSRRVARDEQLKLLIAAIDALTPLEKRIAIEYLLEGRAAAELATELGLASEGALRMRALRLRERLLGEFPFAVEFLGE